MSKRSKLTGKQAKFIEAYLRHGNGTRAAREAGYAGSDHTLNQVSMENLIKPMIAAEIKKRQNIDIEKTGLTREKILKTLETVMDDGDKDSDKVSASNVASKILGLQNHDKKIKFEGSIHAAVVDEIEKLK